MSARKPRPSGKSASRATGTRSNGSRKTPGRLEQLLAAAYDEVQKLDEPKLNARRRRNFIFHMTDWSEDLRQLAEVYQHPERFDRTEAGQVIVRFLYHVIPHLKAAGQLMLDYSPEDIFRDLDCSSG